MTLLGHDVLKRKHGLPYVTPSHACGINGKFIPNRIQQYNTVCMTNITNSRVIKDIVIWFC